MKQLLERSSVLILIFYVLFESCRSFHKVAWGTGNLWQGFSMKWAAAFLLFCAICAFILLAAWDSLFHRKLFQSGFDRLVTLRERMGQVRWLPALFVLIFPVWFLQYSPWGVVFNDIHIRILIWSMAVGGFAFLIKTGEAVVGWRELIIGFILTSSIFTMAVAFLRVTDHPFSLGWSEGNRLWDYSVMFARSLYDYPADREIFVLLDSSRQFVGGLPFLIPGLTIQAERFWLGLTVILPYLFLGFAAFRSTRGNWALYSLAALWVMLFLKQGPIHPPLVLCAVVVALVWKKPLWVALPLIALTGYAAEQSRYTWLFAPGLWIGMLELAGAELQDGKLDRSSWVRSAVLALAGMAGGYFGQHITGFLAGNAETAPAISVEGVTASVSSQPLLWYRLLPNATYGSGILAGLLIATLPLILVLSWLVVSRRWRMNIWQGLAILSPLLAFLGVGLIASTKIGGGGDLHNMDMFLIGMLFTAVIAWEKAGKILFENIHLFPTGWKLVLLFLFALPGFQPLGEMRSFNYAEELSWLRTLTDAPKQSTLNMYPPQEVVESALETIRDEIARVRSRGGEILFMDQRQLMTFGFVRGVPLVPDYEKKLLMEKALRSDAEYFREYYDDLAAKRFGLIVSEVLRTPVKDSSFVFGEENNAWVRWVSIPTLCYYEPKVTLAKVGVQLLVPREGVLDCSTSLPEEAGP